MFSELKLIDNFNILFDNKVVIYGAGNCGYRIYRLMKAAGISVSYFCDKNDDKRWCMIDGIKVIPPSTLKTFDEKNSIVIIIATYSVTDIENIKHTIDSLTLRTKNIFTYLSFEMSLTQNIYNPLIKKELMPFLHQLVKLEKASAEYNRQRIDLSFIISQLGFVNDILVYQPGKVGSSTIVNSIIKSGRSCSHVHFLTEHHTYHEHINTFLRAYCNEISKKDSIKIITLVRDPLARAVSGFFQAVGEFGAAVIQEGCTLNETYIRWLKEQSSIPVPRFGDEFEWFNDEIKSVFNVDVFAHSFDKEKGYTIINQDNIELLVIKLEKLNSLEAVIGEYIGNPDSFKLLKANEGSNKPYTYLYKDVRESIKIPHKIISHYYDNNPQLNHFYNNEEVASFISKWSK